MIKEQIIKVGSLLKQAGFLDKEISVFLALLEIGRGKVSEISRKAGINRTTGYVILDGLANKGLVGISGKEPKQEYMAESPEKLVNFLNNKARKQKFIADEVNKILPELMTTYNIGDRPKVRFYEGIEGLKQVYEDTLTASKSIVAYATFDDMHKTLPNYFPDYYKRRAKKGIFARGIAPDTPLARERMKLGKEEARDLALVPVDKYNFSPEIDIYDNKIMIASWREKLGIIIESGEIADAMKKIFELAWLQAKNMGKLE
ncbi:MAG: helix-turn-helix domain-containing protein [Candidatus Pacebacteria bacterium]|nr:helix-turn-helix domain-containing protein [Candidatus Paceibacterota bacterium]